LARAFKAIAAEHTEQLLAAVGHEDDAYNDAQNSDAIAGAGVEQGFDMSVHAGRSMVISENGAILIESINMKIAKIASYLSNKPILSKRRSAG
jgi:hypothetical protein